MMTSKVTKALLRRTGKAEKYMLEAYTLLNNHTPDSPGWEEILTRIYNCIELLNGEKDFLAVRLKRRKNE